jgi:WD40 repeat protein
MQSQQGSEVLRRRLLAAGTADFRSEELDDLQDVPKEINDIQQLFTGLGYELEPEAMNLGHTSLLTRCADLRKSVVAGDVLVTYYTSHGRRDRERFYLLTTDSDLKCLDETAVAAEDFARLLIKDSCAKQVLIILDVCSAGSGSVDITRLTTALAMTSRDRDPELYLIAATGIKQPAQQCAFTDAFTAVLANLDERLAGRTQPYLQLGSLIAEINKKLDPAISQVARWYCLGAVGECLAFPNPNFRSNLRPGLDLETQAAFEEHWIPKARSADMGVQGWYFTGREDALQLLVAWLNKPSSDGRARVVTGSAGSGKSAVLARIVTLSHSRLRQEVLGAKLEPLPSTTLPPEGGVNAAVLLRRKLLADVVADLTSQLLLPATDAQGLRDAIAAAKRKTVLVIDALDEADERQPIVDELLRPLAVLPHVFLLIGTRPDPGSESRTSGPQVQAFAGASVELDLDTINFGKPEDVTEYIRRRLLATEEPRRTTPYQASPQQADQIAAALAERIDYSFLVARTAVSTLLARSEALEICQPGWQEQLPGGFEEALEQFLQQLDHSETSGLSRTVVFAALQALAFSEGEGLPWEQIWAHVASAVSDIQITDEHIRSVRHVAAPFIVETVESGGSVYRLFHEKASEYLRGKSSRSLAQRAISAALCQLVPLEPNKQVLDWKNAHPYILSHLPNHALHGGILSALIEQHGILFLASCNPLRLLPALQSLPPESGIFGKIYANAFENLRISSVDERQAYLQLSALQLGQGSLASTWDSPCLMPSWKPRWGWFTDQREHRRIQCDLLADSAEVVAYQDKWIVIACGNGIINAWELDSGTTVDLSNLEQINTPVEMAAISYPGKSIVAIAGIDGDIQVWDLTCSRLMLSLFMERANGLSLCLVPPCAGHSNEDNSDTDSSLPSNSCDPLLVATDSAGIIRVWNLNTGLLAHQMDNLNVSIHMVSWAIVGGARKIVTSSQDGKVRLWDLSRGIAEGIPFDHDDNRVLSFACTVYLGIEVFISGCLDGSIIIWNPNNNNEVRPRLFSHGLPVTALTVIASDGLHRLIAGYDDGTIIEWDLLQESCIVNTCSAHGEGVHSLITVPNALVPTYVSVARDATIRVWKIDSDLTVSRPPATVDNINAILFTNIDAHDVVFTGDASGNIFAWNACNGQLFGEPLQPHDDAVNGISSITIDGQDWVLSCGDDKRVVLMTMHSNGLSFVQETVMSVPVEVVDSLDLGDEIMIAAGGQYGMTILMRINDTGWNHLELQGPSRTVIFIKVFRKVNSRYLWSIDNQGGVRGWNFDDIVSLGIGDWNGHFVVTMVSNDSMLIRSISSMEVDDCLYLFLNFGLHIGLYEPNENSICFLSSVHAPLMCGYFTSIVTGRIGGTDVLVGGTTSGYIFIWTLSKSSAFSAEKLPLSIQVGAPISKLDLRENALIIASKSGLTLIEINPKAIFNFV